MLRSELTLMHAVSSLLTLYYSTQEEVFNFKLYLAPASITLWFLAIGHTQLGYNLRTLYYGSGYARVRICTFLDQYSYPPRRLEVE